MGTIGLYRNFDGSLDSRYHNGDLAEYALRLRASLRECNTGKAAMRDLRNAE